MLGDLVAAGDTQIDTSGTHEGRDVSCREEDQRDWQVLDQRDIEAGFAPELYVTTCEEVEGGLLKASLCLTGWSVGCFGCAGSRGLAFGDGEEKSSL